MPGQTAPFGQAGMRYERARAPERAGGRFSEVPGLALAKVIAVHPDTSTVDCVGIGQARGAVWPGVPVVTLGGTPIEGVRWLPTVDPGAGDPFTDGVLTGGQEAIAILGFVGGNPLKPFALGFTVNVQGAAPDTIGSAAGDRLDVHASGVYTRTTATGIVEHVFADGSFLRVAQPSEGTAVLPAAWGGTQVPAQQVTFLHVSGTTIQVTPGGQITLSAPAGVTIMAAGATLQVTPGGTIVAQAAGGTPIDVPRHTHQYTDTSDSGTATKTTGGAQ